MAKMDCVGTEGVLVDDAVPRLHCPARDQSADWQPRFCQSAPVQMWLLM